MSEPTTLAMEEQAGLLKQDELGSRPSSESWEEEALRWKERPATQRHGPRRRWITTITISILIACTISLLLDFAITRHYPKGAGASLARLRPEEDYILNPTWDFNAAPTTREYTWVIDDHELNPDGVYRPMVLINSTFPGPLIECNEGDELVVHVRNQAVNSTSIHWHGLYQNGSNWMDGTTGVTQCPIAPDQSFTYRFNVTGQSGTYYYHSHVSMQASDGLVGPLVIHGRGGEGKDLQRVPYEQDRVVMLSDYYYDLSSDLLMQYLAPGSENDEPVPPSALINGRNVRDYRKITSTFRLVGYFEYAPAHCQRGRICRILATD
jgi:FtsP/CotA-like multicopper oxidase with cupredoxin domain